MKNERKPLDISYVVDTMGKMELNIEISLIKAKAPEMAIPLLWRIRPILDLQRLLIRRFEA